MPLNVPTFSGLFAGIVTWCSEPLKADLTRMWLPLLYLSFRAQRGICFFFSFLLPDYLVTVSAQQPGKFCAGEIARQYHATMTSSFTICSRMSLGLFSFSK